MIIWDILATLGVRSITVEHTGHRGVQSTAAKDRVPTEITMCRSALPRSALLRTRYALRPACRTSESKLAGCCFSIVEIEGLDARNVGSQELYFGGGMKQEEKRHQGRSTWESPDGSQG